MKNRVLIRDIPFGFLIMILSMFIVYLAWMTSDYIDMSRFIIVVFLINLAKFVFSIGYKVAKGVNFRVE